MERPTVRSALKPVNELRWDSQDQLSHINALRMMCHLHNVMWNIWRNNPWWYKWMGEPELTEEGAIILRNV